MVSEGMGKVCPYGYINDLNYNDKICKDTIKGESNLKIL